MSESIARVTGEKKYLEVVLNCILDRNEEIVSHFVGKKCRGTSEMGLLAVVIGKDQISS